MNMTAIDRWKQLTEHYLGKIESGIPIPKPKKDTWAPPYQEIARAMKKGDSILMENVKHAQSLRAAIYSKNGAASLREEEGGIRVWKTKE